MTPEETRALFRRREEAWRRLDAAMLTADHADESVVESPVSGVITGRRAIEAAYASWFSAFPDLEFRTEDLLVEGNRAALFMRVSGTHVGPFWGLAPTGRRFELSGVFLYTLHEDEIVHERRIYDFTALMLQIGALKAKPAKSI